MEECRMNSHGYRLLSGKRFPIVICVDNKNLGNNLQNASVLDAVINKIIESFDRPKVKQSIDLMVVTTKNEKTSFYSITSYRKYSNHVCDNLFDAINFSYSEIDKYLERLEDIEIRYYSPMVFVIGIDFLLDAENKTFIKRMCEEKNNIVTIPINICDKKEGQLHDSDIELDKNYVINIEEISSVDLLNVEVILHQVIASAHRLDEYTIEEQKEGVLRFINEINSNLRKRLNVMENPRDIHIDYSNKESIWQKIKDDMDDLLADLMSEQ